MQDVDLEAAETGPATGMCDQVFDGAADAGCDGLLVDKSDGGSGLKETLLLGFVGAVVGGGGDGDGCDGGLNHAERGNDLVEHVGELCDC